MIPFKKNITQVKGNPNGFTLLEAVIAIAVFSVGILGMLALQTSSVNNNTLAETVQENSVAGMGEIEELMATDFLDWRIINDGGPDCYDIDYPEYTNTPVYRVCTERWDDVAIPGAKKIFVTSQILSNGQIITLKIIKPDIDQITP